MGAKWDNDKLKKNENPRGLLLTIFFVKIVKVNIYCVGLDC